MAVCAAILILAAAVLGGLVATGGIQLMSHPTTALAAAQAGSSSDPAAIGDPAASSDPTARPNETSNVAESPPDSTPAPAALGAAQAKPHTHVSSTINPGASQH